MKSTRKSLIVVLAQLSIVVKCFSKIKKKSCSDNSLQVRYVCCYLGMDFDFFFFASGFRPSLGALTETWNSSICCPREALMHSQPSVKL